MRIIVCGGRDYHDKAALFRAMDKAHSLKPITFLIQGGANGADFLGWTWGDERGVSCGSYNADWKKHGKAAGPIRNAEMISQGKPDGVIAFPGGAGTADMVRQAEAAGIKVWKPYG